MGESEVTSCLGTLATIRRHVAAFQTVNRAVELNGDYSHLRVVTTSFSRVLWAPWVVTTFSPHDSSCIQLSSAGQRQGCQVVTWHRAHQTTSPTSLPAAEHCTVNIQCVLSQQFSQHLGEEFCCDFYDTQPAGQAVCMLAAV